MANRFRCKAHFEQKVVLTKKKTLSFIIKQFVNLQKLTKTNFSETFVKCNGIINWWFQQETWKFDAKLVVTISAEGILWALTLLLWCCNGRTVKEKITEIRNTNNKTAFIAERHKSTSFGRTTQQTIFKITKIKLLSIETVFSVGSRSPDDAISALWRQVSF